MDETVNSEFTTQFKVQTGLITAIVFSAIIFFTTYVYHNPKYSRGEFTGEVILAVILLGVYLYLLSRNIQQLTISAESMILYYPITKKQIVIDYADIVHVRNMRNTSNSESIKFSSLNLEIELSTGETFSFSDSVYENYYELKDSISHYRFAKNNRE